MYAFDAALDIEAFSFALASISMIRPMSTRRVVCMVSQEFASILECGQMCVRQIGGRIYLGHRPHQDHGRMQGLQVWLGYSSQSR
jgi:hypothetical protein